MGSQVCVLKFLEMQDDLGQIYRPYPYIYLTPEKAFEFHFQKFNMELSLSAVIFATANFH